MRQGRSLLIVLFFVAITVYVQYNASHDLKDNNPSALVHRDSSQDSEVPQPAEFFNAEWSNLTALDRYIRNMAYQHNTRLRTPNKRLLTFEEQHTQTCLDLWRQKQAYFEARKELRLNELKLRKDNYGTGEHAWEVYVGEQLVDGESRVGRLIDGGKYLTDIEAPPGGSECLAYSVGSWGEYSYEKDLLFQSKHDCEMHTFDPNVDQFGSIEMMEGIARELNFTFHPEGFATERDASGRFDNLKGFMERYNQSHRVMSYLKVDCEGCEYGFFPQVFQDIAAGNVDVRHLMVELHKQMVDVDHHEFFYNADAADMRLIHRDPNFIGCEGYHCAEFAWISGKEAFRNHVLHRCPELLPTWEKVYTSLNKA